MIPAFPGFTRPMHPGEEAAVADLLDTAFGGSDESQLVEALRKSGDMAGEMVLPMGERVIGYYALSPFRAPKGWLCLAPVAIAPDLQGHGHGRRMIGQLAEWARLTRQYVVVLGQVEFYEKAGFRKDRAAKLTSPYPLEHTLLAGPGEDAPAQALRYPKPFDGL
ncbi:GNAT family N-acetyltransferase [Roseovarius sp.]|uniref:GNAT family N-acetyltransferase n=1 Tax=Roseovarius sp. TaxID=1486281 RepID=UPI003BAB88D7